MKSLRNLILLVAVAGFIASCSNAPKGEKAVTKEAAKVEKVANVQTYNVNLANSIVNWEGSKVGGAHTGTLKLSSGSVDTKGGKVTGGRFKIDMNTMACTDLPAEKGADLVGHLSSPDFFEVSKFPDALFEITKVTGLQGSDEANSLVYGNLTMKGVTKEISFKANVEVGDSGVKVSTPNFTIDRTDFGIQYGSTKLADVVKDKAINDNVGLSISLSAS